MESYKVGIKQIHGFSVPSHNRFITVSCWFGTDNLVENLLGDFEYEVQSPYLLYRNAAQEVNGIWFFSPRECEDVANLFTRHVHCSYNLGMILLVIQLLWTLGMQFGRFE